MSNEKNKNQTEITDEIVNLVVDRLETIPPNVAISIGREGSFEVRELIERVKAKDEIGKKIIDMQLNYLRTLPEFIYSKKDAPDHKASLR